MDSFINDLTLLAIYSQTSKTSLFDSKNFPQYHPLSPSATSSPALPALRTQSPVIFAGREAVMEWLYPFFLFPLTKSIRWRNLEEGRRGFDEPSRIDNRHVVHIFFGSFD
jgi:hypothetical protein